MTTHVKLFTVTIATLVLLSVVGIAYSASFPLLSSLPIGSRDAIDTYVETQVSEIDLALAFNSGSSIWVNHWTNLPYNPSMGKLEDVIKSNMDVFCNLCAKATYVGHTSYVAVRLIYVEPFGSSWIISRDEGRDFIVSTNESGKFILPWEKVLPWPLVDWIPITDGLKYVTRVAYEWSVPTGNGTNTYVWNRWSTSDGLPLGCPLSTIKNNVLYLMANFVDPLNQVNTSQHLEIVLTYKGGAQTVFDGPTGLIRKSNCVELEMQNTNGQPVLRLRGFPGTQVAVEASTNRNSWTTQGSVTLAAEGEGTFSMPANTQPLHVRGRIIP